jgi:hypothetical protein
MAAIEILGGPSHVNSVQAAMDLARKTQVGQILFADMQATKKKLVIKPYEGNDDPVYGPCNALTRAASAWDSAPDGVGKGAPWYKGLGDSIYTRDKDERHEENPSGHVGTGKGSNVELQFSPDVIAEKSCYGGKSGSLPDEMFVHEIVHVLRMMQGKRNPYPTKNPAYTNEEEFLAVVTANVYISEKGSSDLRRDYDGHSPLAAPLNTSSGFLSNPDNLRLMSIYHLVWLPTFLNLSKVIKATFNPFRQLVQDLAHLESPAPKPKTKTAPVWFPGIQHRR